MEHNHNCANCEHAECCGRNVEKVRLYASKMISEEEAYYISELYKAMSDPTRVRILFSRIPGEMCVCDITELVGVSQSAVSHQLRTLKQAGLVRYRRDGKTMYYSIADSHVSTMLAMGLEHIAE
ncbi:MAG: winged helix-turn-helix transcriptional regulator [Oscillospiraceae bacterium]|nr:winged helix-turn-helix transcriptional regulator [Oscillospiraceae bacterium]